MLAVDGADEIRELFKKVGVGFLMVFLVRISAQQQTQHYNSQCSHLSGIFLITLKSEGCFLVSILSIYLLGGPRQPPPLTFTPLSCRGCITTGKGGLDYQFTEGNEGLVTPPAGFELRV